MEFVPIGFNLKRENSLLSIITITGFSKDMPETQRVMLKIIVELIELVENKYEGKAIGSIGHDNDKIDEGMLYVKAYILFKNDKDLEKAVLGIKKELG